MKPKLLLRIAAVLMLLHTIGHTFGALGWKMAPNETIKKVIEGMENNRFSFMGRMGSLANFYTGYGIIMIGVLLLISIVLWLLADDLVSASSLKVSVLLGVFLFFMAVVEYVYFFPFAAAFSLLASISTSLTLKHYHSYGTTRLS